MEYILAILILLKMQKKIDKISYEEMLEMSSLGSKVLHTRSVRTGNEK